MKKKAWGWEGVHKGEWKGQWGSMKVHESAVRGAARIMQGCMRESDKVHKGVWGCCTDWKSMYGWTRVKDFKKSIQVCMGMQQDWTRVGTQCEEMQQEIRKGGRGCMEMQQSCLGVWGELGKLILSGVCKILETIKGMSQPPLYWGDYGGISCNALKYIFPDFSELVLNCCLWDKLSFELACYLLSCSYSLLSYPPKNPHNNSYWDTFNCIFSWAAGMQC